MTTGLFDLELSRLSRPSKLFAARLFERLPNLQAKARMERSAVPDAFDLLVEIPSPTGDADRQVLVWMDASLTPSVAFGAWHTHGGGDPESAAFVDEAQRIVDQIAAILADHQVLLYDVGGQYDGHCEVVDLRNENALAEELTSKLSSGRVRIKTWSGAGDREIGLDDLFLD